MVGKLAIGMNRCRYSPLSPKSPPLLDRTWLDDVAAVEGILAHEEHAVEHCVVLGVQWRKGREAAGCCDKALVRFSLWVWARARSQKPEGYRAIPGSRSSASEMGC